MHQHMTHAYDLIPCDLLMFLPKFLCNQISRLPYNLQILDDRKTQILFLEYSSKVTSVVNSMTLFIASSICRRRVLSLGFSLIYQYFIPIYRRNGEILQLSFLHQITLRCNNWLRASTIPAYLNNVIRAWESKRTRISISLSFVSSPREQEPNTHAFSMVAKRKSLLAY